MQGAVRLAKFKYYPDNTTNNGVIKAYFLGHCSGQWNLRDMFINWICIMLLPIIWISKIHVHKFHF